MSTSSKSVFVCPPRVDGKAVRSECLFQYGYHTPVIDLIEIGEDQHEMVSRGVGRDACFGLERGILTQRDEPVQVRGGPGLILIRLEIGREVVKAKSVAEGGSKEMDVEIGGAVAAESLLVRPGTVLEIAPS